MNRQQYQELNYEKFLTYLKHPIKRGLGLHRHIYALCCFGVKANLSCSDCVSYISSVYESIRKGEIEESYRNAQISVEPFTELISSNPITTPTPIPISVNINKTLLTEDIMELSEVFIGDKREDSINFINHLFNKDDYIYMGSGFTTEVKLRDEWLETDTTKYEFIGCNPYTGIEGETKGGKKSYRADSSVKEYMYCVAEMDGLPLEKQTFFWYSIIKENFLPVVSVVYSGSKSLHAIIKLNLRKDPIAWEKEVKNKLYKNCLVRYGCDMACANVGRLTRNVGYTRKDTNKEQKLLYLRE